jgi:hypothetical protein
LVFPDANSILQLSKISEEESNTFTVVLENFQLHHVSFKNFNLGLAKLLFNGLDELGDLTQIENILVE